MRTTESWKRAEDAGRRGDELVKQNHHREARAAFVEAERLYQAAGRSERIDQARTNAERMRAGAIHAREAAVRGNAPQSAAETFRAGSQRERDGDLALGRGDYQEAERSYRDAQTRYEDARAAAKVAIARDESERTKAIGEARRSAAALRDAARAAGAETLARPQLDAATAKWTQAESQASTGSAAAAVVQAFQEAEKLYTDAEHRVKDVVREAEGSARTRRDAAIRAGADMLAKELFDPASTRLREGETSARAQNWPGAVQAYRDAADRFGDAERRVGDLGRVRTEAEAAKNSREQAVRAGAETLAKELFDAAAASHVEADRLARGTNPVAAIPGYRQTAQRYGQAEQRARELSPGRAGSGKAPAAASTSAQGEIRAVLADYTRAFESKDAALLQRLRPGLTIARSGTPSRSSRSRSRSTASTSAATRPTSPDGAKT